MSTKYSNFCLRVKTAHHYCNVDDDAHGNGNVLVGNSVSPWMLDDSTTANGK